MEFKLNPKREAAITAVGAAQSAFDRADRAVQDATSLPEYTAAIRCRSQARTALTTASQRMREEYEAERARNRR